MTADDVCIRKLQLRLLDDLIWDMCGQYVWSKGTGEGNNVLIQNVH